MAGPPVPGHAAGAPAVPDGELARFARAMQSLADGLWEWDVAADGEYLSPRGMELLGKAWTGHLVEAWHADDQGQWRAALQSHLLHGAPLDIDVRLASTDSRWLRCRGWTERDARGRPLRVLATLSDVTVAKFTEQALTDSQSKFRALFHTVPVGIALLDLATETVVEANDELARLLGWQPLAVVGRRADELGLWTAATGRELVYAPLTTTGRAEVGALEIRHQTGQRLHVKLVAEKVELGGHTLLLCAIVDISVQVQAEVALAALAEQLMDQERRTTQRVAMALHDQLGQTLTALRFTLDLAGQSADLREQARGLIDQALREVRQVLVDLRPPLLEDEGLAAALDNEVAHRRALHPDVRLFLHVDEALQIQRSPPQVEYAFFMVARETLENALRHANPGSIWLSLYGGEGEIEMDIEDDGDGLAPGTDRGQPGLVGVRERARAIGATLDLAERKGGGTRVTLRWSAPA